MKSFSDLTDAQLTAYNKGDLSGFTDDELTSIAGFESADKAQPKTVVDDGIGSVIKETKEGGKFYRLGAGKVGYSSTGYSTTNQEEVKRLLSEMASEDFIQPTEQAMTQQRQDIISQAPLTARGLKFSEGTVAAGSYIDEAAESIDPQLGAKTRAVSAAMDEENPIESMLLQTAGAVVSALPVGMLAVGSRLTGAADFVATNLTRGQRMLSGLLKGVPLATAEGGIYGYGEGKDGTRQKTATTGAMFGLVPSAGLALGGPVLQDFIKRVREADTGFIADIFEISTGAARLVKDAFSSGASLDDAVARIRSAGDQGMVADAGTAADHLLDAAAATTPAASEATQQVVGNRAAAASRSITETMDETLGVTPTGNKEAFKEISQKSAADRSDAYKTAYGKAVDYSSAAGMKIEEVLSRINPKALQNAISEANDDMLADGVSNPQIMAIIGENGKVSFKEMPNVQQLDYMKRALNAMADDLTDPLTGAVQSSGRRFIKLSKELRAAIGDAVPEYNVAVKLGGDKILEDNALKLGGVLLDKKTKRETVEYLAKASVDERAAASQGVRSQIENTLAEVKNSLATPDLDIKEAQKLLTDLSSRANLEKLAFIIGPKGVADMMEKLEMVRRALTLQQAVAKNSATAGRISQQRIAETQLNAGPVNALMRGKPLAAIQEAIMLALGTDAKSQAARSSAMFGDVIKALTSMRGEEAVNALELMTKVINKQIQITDVQADKIARLVLSQAPATAVVSGRQINEDK